MKLNEYGSQAVKFIKYDEYNPFNYLLPALAEEVGELQSIFSKNARKHGDYELDCEQIAEVCYELGDILWNIAAFAHEMGFTLEEIAENNILKLSARKKKGTLTDVARES